MTKLFTSDDAFRMIHDYLGQWVKGSLEDAGFQDEPVRADGKGHADELVLIAAMMRQIEEHTALTPPKPRTAEKE